MAADDDQKQLVLFADVDDSNKCATEVVPCLETMMRNGRYVHLFDAMNTALLRGMNGAVTHAHSVAAEMAVADMSRTALLTCSDGLHLVIGSNSPYSRKLLKCAAAVKATTAKNRQNLFLGLPGPEQVLRNSTLLLLDNPRSATEMQDTLDALYAQSLRSESMCPSSGKLFIFCSE